MILHLQRFVDQEQKYWKELEQCVDRLEQNPEHRLSMSDTQHFHHLYRRASADLIKISNFTSDHGIRTYLEMLIARAYAEIHETRLKPQRLDLQKWMCVTFPHTFRKCHRYFTLTVVVTLLGGIFGAGVVMFDPESKPALIPFGHLHHSPSERVAREEGATMDRLKNAKSQFSSQLMTHNTKVAVLTLALGMTFGVGTLIVIFYNGVVLGAVVMDYILDGQTVFLLGWLLPHGVIEIPAILIAGQASFLLAHALIGTGQSLSLVSRLRRVSRDVVHLICGVSIMLIWAGIVESFFSQYHEPLIPYGVKIAFGLTELALFSCYLGMSGRRSSQAPAGEVQLGARASS
jgi:uncharacterized membrane protein SpoIIM required for sporulation